MKWPAFSSHPSAGVDGRAKVRKNEAMSEFFTRWRAELAAKHDERRSLEKLRTRSAEDERRYQDFVSALQAEENHYEAMKERDRAYEASLREKK